MDKIVSGVSVEQALDVFLKACNKIDTLFITESWIASRLEALTRLLSDTLTDDEAKALRDPVLQRQKLDAVIEWLEHVHDMSWCEYTQHKAHVGVELERVGQEQR